MVYSRKMIRKSVWLMVICLLLNVTQFTQENYLKINAKVTPRIILQGEEGVLKIKITPKNGLKISSHPEFIIKLDTNSGFTFPKIFFTASELNFQTIQEDDAILLDLEKEIEIPFKVKENSLIGRHKISGEVIFTAVFQDHWSVKTYQTFITDFFSKKNLKKKT